MGNTQITFVDRIGSHELTFDFGMFVVFFNVCYVVDMVRNVIPFKALYDDGFDFAFENVTIWALKKCNDIFQV